MKFEYYGRNWKIIPQNLSKSQLGMGMKVDDDLSGFGDVVGGGQARLEWWLADRWPKKVARQMVV